MEKEEIVKKLQPIIDDLGKCGFEVYLVSRTEPKLKKLQLSKEGLHKNLKADIANVIKEQYIIDEAIYAGAECISDNQVKFYVIEQNEQYNPFDVDSWTKEDFKEEQLDDFKGLFFVFRYGEQYIWCYQNRRSGTVANRKNSNCFARIMKYDNGIIFEEQTEKIVKFEHAIDLIVVDETIITSNIGLLERSFDFQIFVQQKSKEAAATVESSQLFTGMDKLNDYLASDVKSHKSYRKKMMKVVDSPVLKMKTADLWSKISTLPRWKGKFKEPVDGKIPIESVKEIESMIDILIERFTVSEVSGQEYDTEVKKKAEEVSD